MFGYLVLSFGFKVYLGHVGFLSFQICKRKNEAKPSHLQGPEHLSHKIRFLITFFSKEKSQVEFRPKRI